MRGVTMAGALALALAAGAAGAAGAADRVGYQAIAAGRFGQAEVALIRERRIHPDRPELMLNLAAVYRATGRDPQARRLYAAVLDRPAVQMDMPDGAVRSSHELAARGLGNSTAIASAR